MSGHVTLLFPGQGSQYVGMGANLINHPLTKNIFCQADETLGFSLTKIISEGPNEDLIKTQYTQPAIFTHSMALFQLIRPFLEEHGLQIKRTLGHSVGEYAALCAAGAISFEQGVLAVHERGKYMQQAVPLGIGKMVAVLKLDEQTIIDACVEIQKRGGTVSPANFNDPTQTVISGEAQACDDVVDYLKSHCQQRFRAIDLPVSAPFHCALMQPAADQLKIHLEQMIFNPLQVPYVANIDAKEYATSTASSIIKENLFRQVAGPVMWTQSSKLLESDIPCLEVGPGKVLKGLIRKINSEINVIQTDVEDCLKELREGLL